MRARAVSLTTALALAVTLMLPTTAGAQRRGRAPSRRPQPARVTAIRSEYAAVLLQTKRYDEAADEYRTLLAADSADASYQLGLARALAWGGHPRDAEPVLRRLARAHPTDTAAARLLIAVRLAMEPSAMEALGWVREEPRNQSFRLALARAYVRERRYPEAFAAFDTLLASHTSVELLREAAGARAVARDSIGNARLLARAVALAGGDVGLRRAYAEGLGWSGNRRGAIAQYTELLRRSRDDPDLLLLRGRQYVYGGEYDAGERDLRASLALRPSRDAYALLGDAYRWRGDYKRSGAAYAAALALVPGDTTVLAGIAALERARLGTVAAGVVADVGWTGQFTHTEDNAGFLYLAAGIGRGFDIGRGSSVGVGAEQRRISTRDSRAAERYIYGFALSARAAHQFGALAASATAGLARHGVVRDIAFGELRAAGGWHASSISATLSTGPAYLPLVSTQSLVQFDADGIVSAKPLIGRTAQVAGSTPFGTLTLSASAEVTALNDGNRRTSGYLGVAYPIAPQVSLLYTGFALGYSSRSDRYWDPTLYSAHSVGAQYASRRQGPLSLTARVLSGVGRATESFAMNGASPIRTTGRPALQLAGSGELAYRTPSWELAARAGYSRGRGGEYQALTSGLRVRIVP